MVKTVIIKRSEPTDRCIRKKNPRREFSETFQRACSQSLTARSSCEHSQRKQNRDRHLSCPYPQIAWLWNSARIFLVYHLPGISSFHTSKLPLPPHSLAIRLHNIWILQIQAFFYFILNHVQFIFHTVFCQAELYLEFQWVKRTHLVLRMKRGCSIWPRWHTGPVRASDALGPQGKGENVPEAAHTPTE